MGWREGLWRMRVCSPAIGPPSRGPSVRRYGRPFREPEKKKMSTTVATVGLSAVTGSEEEGTERGKSEVSR